MSETPGDSKVGLEVKDHEVDQSANQSDHGLDQSPVHQTRWARLKGSIWDTWDKSPEERRLVQKVDWWLLSYACTAYFIKALDQGNVCPEQFVSEVGKSLIYSRHPMPMFPA